MRDHHSGAIKNLIRLPLTVETESIRCSLHPIQESIELASLKRANCKVYRRTPTARFAPCIRARTEMRDLRVAAVGPFADPAARSVRIRLAGPGSDPVMRQIARFEGVRLDLGFCAHRTQPDCILAMKRARPSEKAGCQKHQHRTQEISSRSDGHHDASHLWLSTRAPQIDAKGGLPGLQVPASWSGSPMALSSLPDCIVGGGGGSCQAFLF